MMQYPSDADLELLAVCCKQALHTCSQVRHAAAEIVNGDFSNSTKPPMKADDPRLAQTQMNDAAGLQRPTWMFNNDEVSMFHHFLRMMPHDIMEFNAAYNRTGISDALYATRAGTVRSSEQYGSSFTYIARVICINYGQCLFDFWRSTGLPVTMDDLLQTPRNACSDEESEPSIYNGLLHKVATEICTLQFFDDEELNMQVSREIFRLRWMLPSVTNPRTSSKPEPPFIDVIKSRGGRVTDQQQQLYDIVAASGRALSGKEIVMLYDATYPGLADASSIANALAAMTGSTILRHGPGGKGYRI